MEQKNVTEQVISIQEAEEILGLTANYIRVLCRKQYFKSARQTKEGTWLLSRNEVIADLAFRTQLNREKKRIHRYSDGFVSVRESADRLNVSLQYVLTLCRKGFLKARKNGHYWEIEETSLNELIEQRQRKKADASQ